MATKSTKVLTLLSLSATCLGYSNQFFYHPSSLSVVQRVPELGLTPQYHALVYNYVNSLAGGRPPANVQVYPARVEDFGVRDDVDIGDGGAREPITEGPGPSLQPSSLLPSDFILLARDPQSQFFGNFGAVKNNKMKLGVDSSALPPLGGVVSNYVLLRDQSKEQEKVKRETDFDDVEEDDAVSVVASEARAENTTTTDTDTEDKKEEPQPSVAQSKPSAIALAGVGGVAQAAPVGTAVVGAGGLAIAAPSATAVAGQGTQGAIQIASEEKSRRRMASSEKN